MMAASTCWVASMSAGPGTLAACRGSRDSRSFLKPSLSRVRTVVSSEPEWWDRRRSCQWRPTRQQGIREEASPGARRETMSWRPRLGSSVKVRMTSRRARTIGLPCGPPLGDSMLPVR